MNRSILNLLIILASATASLAQEKKEKLPDHALPVMQDWLSQSSEAVEICVYREEWEAPTEKLWKGVLKRYATITYVHKGSVKVGEHVMLTNYIEFPRREWKKHANLRPSRVSMVEGELEVVLFSRDSTSKTDKYWDLSGRHFKFGSDFHKAFLIEKKRDPKLKGIDGDDGCRLLER